MDTSYNSRDSQRGVGILMKKNIFENIQVWCRIDSDDGNYMLLHINIKNMELLLCSVYGPNRDNEIAFYTHLKNDLNNFHCPVICGGDWNATFDASPVESNLDTVNMNGIPSLARTNKILDLCTALNLIEPYRTLYPNRTEYIYIPTSLIEQNRSRLDFFLKSNTVFGTGTGVRIPNSLTSTMFDHKPVQFILKRLKPSRKNIIKDYILKHVDLRHL